MKNATILLLFTVCLIGCRGKKSPAPADDGFLTLNVAGAIDNPQPFDLAEIADEIDFVPLDNSRREGLVGYIGEVAESKNRFYIAEGNGISQEPIKAFDKTGRFVSTVGSVGRGPNEYLSVTDIAVDYEQDHVYALDNRGGQIFSHLLAYDSTGRMFARNDSIIYPLLVWHEDRPVLLRNFFDRSTAKGDTVTYIETLSPDLHQVGEIKIPYGGSNELTFQYSQGGFLFQLVPPIFSDNGTSLLIKEPRNDTVFRYVDQATLEPLFRVEMGDYFPADKLLDENQWMDGSVVDDVMKNRRSSPFEKYNHGWVTAIYEGERYLVVEIGSNKRGYCIFDKNDLIPGFWVKGGLWVDGIAFTPSYIRDNSLVGYMQALDIVDNAEHITDPDLKALAATLTEDDNPVIVVVKLKK